MKAINRIMCRSLLIAIWSVIMCMTVWAGSINGNEQSVLGVIYGSFESGGVTYKVSQEYINSAIAYMSQDDVDLTSEQAQEAIGEIYANVSTGVESGYLYPVGGEPQTDEETQPDTPEETQAQYGDESDSETETASDSEETQPDESEETQPEEPSSEVQDESIAEIIEEIKSKPQVITILEAAASSTRADNTDIESGTDIYMNSIYYPTREVRLILLVLTVVVVLAGIAAYFSKRYHKRRLRKILRAILTCVLCISCIISIAGVSAYIGAFNKSIVLNHMSESGYYHAVYDVLRTDTEMSLALMGIPLSVMDDAVTYERVVTAARQQVEDRLNGGNYQADTTLISSKLEDNIRSYLNERDIGLTEQAELGLGLLISRLNDKYHALLQWPYTSWWLYLSQRFSLYASYGAPALILLLIASELIIIYLNHYRHRGVRLCGYGIMAASVVSAAAALIGIWLEGSKVRGISPDYMEQFFHDYVGGMLFAALIVSLIGIMIGIGHVLIARYMKEER